MIPVYLNNLLLNEVFATYCKDVDEYIQSSNNDEHIVDSETEKISGFVTDSFGHIEDASGKYFSVKNPTKLPYVLLQIDNGIIKSSKIKKCDCAIANDTQLCFIEFKANAYSSNENTIQGNYQKAIKQLTTTIGLFERLYDAKRVDKLKKRKNVEAFICFRQGYPKTTSSQMNYQVAFASTNNGIPLSFKREKVLL